MGWNSLTEGSFASTICKVKTDKFEYGSDDMTYYNVGYPLHRLVEGTGTSLIGEDVGEILEVTAYVRTRPNYRVVLTDQTIEAISVPPDARNAFYANNAAAKLIGVDAEGVFMVFPDELVPASAETLDGLWENRFFGNHIPTFRNFSSNNCTYPDFCIT